MDPLSTLLAHLKPQVHHAGRFDIGTKQSIVFPRYEGMKCYTVVDGECWISLEGDLEASVLKPGDCFLLTHGDGFQLASEPGSPVLALDALVAAMHKGLPGLYEGAPGCTLAGGHFAFRGSPVELLSDLLPALLVLPPKKARSSSVQITLERMKDEVRTDQLGGSFLLQQLAYLLLLDVLRAHLSRASSGAVGWLYAMSDPSLRPALVAIHESSNRPWTLEALAQHVGMSRSLFARRFKEQVGESPIDHLTRWRIMRASEQVITTRTSVLEIAIASGYENESSFGKAYKRIIGLSPRQHRFGI